MQFPEVAVAHRDTTGESSIRQYQPRPWSRRFILPLCLRTKCYLSVRLCESLCALELHRSNVPRSVRAAVSSSSCRRTKVLARCCCCFCLQAKCRSLAGGASTVRSNDCICMTDLAFYATCRSLDAHTFTGASGYWISRGSQNSSLWESAPSNGFFLYISTNVRGSHSNLPFAGGRFPQDDHKPVEGHRQRDAGSSSPWSHEAGTAALVQVRSIAVGEGQERETADRGLP